MNFKHLSNTVFVIAVSILLFSIQASAQFNCGTKVTAEQIAKEKAQSASNLKLVPNKCLNKELSIAVYIVRDSLGQENTTSTQISDAITILNQDFAPICLSFKICSTEFINDFNYDNFDDSIDEREVRVLYDKPKTITMYFVENIESKNPFVVCGYASFPGGPDHILIKKSCVDDKLTLSHEMGHFLGLYHTFETGFGNELSSGNNCVSAGDLLCDTPADPHIENGCNYTSPVRDAEGNYYYPMIGNIMSYFGASCKCDFTRDQYNRMINQFLTIRNYLY